MDCVLSYHLNLLTCGVARFNHRLAQTLAVPMLQLSDPASLDFQRPLVSIKVSEFTEEDLPELERLAARLEQGAPWRLFLHDYSDTPLEHRLIRGAERVYCANHELTQRVRETRADVDEVWCPGSLVQAEPFDPTELTVFAFGMAHKIRADYYARLWELLEQTGKSHSLSLSTALHENTSFDDSFTAVLEELRAAYRGKLHFLGYLSDAAVRHYLTETTFFASFFTEGVRANNTSVHVAMLCGSVVITNLDENSPDWYVHMDNIIDIRRCDSLPTDPEVLQRIQSRARETALAYDWPQLVDRLREPAPVVH